MAITHVDIDVASPADPEHPETVTMLVDSGAFNSVVPAALLERLGIRPLSEQVCRLANGEKITRRKGIAAFRFRGRVGGADVVFGEAGDLTLLGATTLESLGLGLDPLRRELLELPMML